jgi:hypothetical protein
VVNERMKSRSADGHWAFDARRGKGPAVRILGAEIRQKFHAGPSWPTPDYLG